MAEKSTNVYTVGGSNRESAEESEADFPRARELQRLAALVMVRAAATLRADKRRSYLGYLWWIMEPLIWMVAFWLAFASGLKGMGSKHDYIPFLMCGLVPWKWFATSFLGGGNSIFGSQGLMLQVNLPKVILPLSIIVANTFKFLITLGLLLIFMLIYARNPSWEWFYVPILLVCQGIFICGTTILLSSIIPVFPDIHGMLQNGIMLLFLMSGIFFDIEKIPGLAGTVFHLDPMADVITAWRAVLIDGAHPHWGWMLYVLAIGLICMVAGLGLIKRYEQRYAKMVS